MHILPIRIFCEFAILHFAFCILHFAFCILHFAYFAFCTLHVLHIFEFATICKYASKVFIQDAWLQGPNQSLNKVLSQPVTDMGRLSDLGPVDNYIWTSLTLRFTLTWSGLGGLWFIAIITLLMFVVLMMRSWRSYFKEIMNYPRKIYIFFISFLYIEFFRNNIAIVTSLEKILKQTKAVWKEKQRLAGLIGPRR